jgi:hypothetical protein
MRILILALFLLMAGCSGGIYKVPTGEYRQQVKTLGVLPLMVDGRSVISHPAANEILGLLRRGAAGRSEVVVEELRRKKGYFDVRFVPEPARILAEKLLVKADYDERGLPRGYRLNQQFLTELCKDSFVDGLLLLSLQGVLHKDKRWSRKSLETLTTDYNDILATASVVAADGRVLWEMNGADAATILSLQYPDFDEAYFNKTDAVKLKFIGFSGLEKTLLPAAENEREKPWSPQITAWLDKVTAALSPTLFR